MLWVYFCLIFYSIIVSKGVSVVPCSGALSWSGSKTLPCIANVTFSNSVLLRPVSNFFTKSLNVSLELHLTLTGGDRFGKQTWTVIKTMFTFSSNFDPETRPRLDKVPSSLAGHICLPSKKRMASWFSWRELHEGISSMSAFRLFSLSIFMVCKMPFSFSTVIWIYSGIMSINVGCGLQMSPLGRTLLGASDRQALPWYSFWSLRETFNLLSICSIKSRTFALPGCTFREKFGSVDVSIIISSSVSISLRFLVGRPLLKTKNKKQKQDNQFFYLTVSIMI